MIKDTKEAIEQLVDFFGDDKEYKEAIESDDWGDIIPEIADSNCDIYNNDLIKWLGGDVDNAWSFNEAIDEFGWEGCGKDLFKAIQMAQYKANSDLLYEAVEEIKD